MALTIIILILAAFFFTLQLKKKAIAVQYWRSLVRVIERERNIYYVIQVGQAWGKRLILRSIIFCKSVGNVALAGVGGKQENKKKNGAYEPIGEFTNSYGKSVTIYSGSLLKEDAPLTKLKRQVNQQDLLLSF